jgi:hypothetical protein
MVLAYKQTHRSIEQNKEARNKSTHLESIGFWQIVKNIQWRKNSLSIIDAEIIGYLHVEE